MNISCADTLRELSRPSTPHTPKMRQPGSGSNSNLTPSSAAEPYLRSSAALQKRSSTSIEHVQQLEKQLRDMESYTQTQSKQVCHAELLRCYKIVQTADCWQSLMSGMIL